MEVVKDVFILTGTAEVSFSVEIEATTNADALQIFGDDIFDFIMHQSDSELNNIKVTNIEIQ